jgi:hypothetical protein
VWCLADTAAVAAAEQLEPLLLCLLGITLLLMRGSQ